MERECAYLLEAIGVKNFIDRYRCTIFIVSALLFTLLSLAYAHFLKFDCIVPFSACYHSWLEMPLVCTLEIWSLVLLFSALILSGKHPSLHKNLLLINFIVGIAILAATIIYHLNYDGHPKKLAFRDYQPVTPFHLQLSNILFTYTLVLNFVLLLFSGPRLLRVISVFLPAPAILIIHLMR